jgi:tetratricopeptide (TPR) repeat protein
MLQHRFTLLLALAAAAAGCSTAPVEKPKEPPPKEEPEPEVEPRPVVKPDPLGPKMVAEADRLFTEASRSRAAGKPDDAADQYAASIAIYDARAQFDTNPALPIRAANAREARARAVAEAEEAARAKYREEFLATLPPAPFPDDASLLKHYEELVARNPDDRASRRRLAALYLAAERYPEAAAALEVGADPEPVLELAQAALWYRLGRNDDAVKKLEDIRRRWRRALPPQILRPAFCLQAPKGFDKFTPAEKAEFFPQQKVWIYFEAGNATCEQMEGGKWRVSLRCDYEILDEKGGSVAWPEVKDFARDYDPPAYGTPVNDVCLMLGIVMPRAPRGKYTMVLRLTDKVENKSAEHRMAFEIK